MNDALHNKVVKWFYDHEELLIAIMNKTPYQSDGWDYEIEVVKEFLTQTEQEPVVWMYQDKSTHEVRFQKHMRGFVDHGATYETPLYTTPPQRKPLTRSINDEMLAALDWITTYIENAPQHLTEAHQWAKISRGIIEAALGIKE